MAKELCQLQMLSELELQGLAAYCCAYEQWVAAYEKVMLLGAVVKTKDGNIIQNPAMAISNRQQAEMRKWMSEFGFTPSSRPRVQTIGGKDQDHDNNESFFS